MDWAGPSVLPQERQQQLPSVLPQSDTEAVAEYDQEVVEMLLVACRSSLNTNQLCDSGDAMME